MRKSLMLALAVILAGCSDGGGKGPDAAADAALDELGLEATATTGVIRGVVVDAAVVPLAGASVLLTDANRTVVTDELGRFGFDDVEPGVHFLLASKAGYAEVQTSVEVVAGASEPDATLMRLVRMPGTEPFILAMQWDGFMQCSFTVAIAFGTGCLIGDFTDDNSRRFDPIDRTPTFMQSELDWEPTQALGSNLCMRHYASEDIGGPLLGPDVCGARPLLQAFNHTVLNETGVGAGMGIERVVWVDDFVVDRTLGLALNQRFTVYTHLFYNFAPTEGWTFIGDGPHPLPP